MYRCRSLADRFAKREGSSGTTRMRRDDYHNDGGEVSPATGQRKWGLIWGPEFSAAGWHVIHPNRPDAKYHML